MLHKATRRARPKALDRLKLFEDDCVMVVIETPKGSPNKLAFEPRYGTFVLKGVLPAGAVFLFDFGFVPSTRAEDGDPLDVLLPLWLPEDANIYFLTHRGSRKVAQVSERPHVPLTVINAGCYLVVLGLAYASQDPARIRRLWRPSYRAWFRKGSDDREATVLRIVINRIVINRVNYWEPPRSRVLPIVRSGHSRRH